METSWRLSLFWSFRPSSSFEKIHCLSRFLNSNVFCRQITVSFEPLWINKTVSSIMQFIDISWAWKSFIAASLKGTVGEVEVINQMINAAWYKGLISSEHIHNQEVWKAMNQSSALSMFSYHENILISRTEVQVQFQLDFSSFTINGLRQGLEISIWNSIINHVKVWECCAQAINQPTIVLRVRTFSTLLEVH